ncbi:MAG TPA: chalcone isomerase family protein [Chitinophagales bacterium]|nr:chalcone isomerase family protein [Chitinophagales bacterium]HNM31356.1 chalcone isomerase family protein [Chitinophagales bacterium]
MKISGIELASKINLNGIDLFLNGAAVRTKFFIQTYIVSLYAAKPIHDEKEGIEGNTERSLRMQIITPLATAKTVSDNILQGMKTGLGPLYEKQKDLVEELRNVIESSGVQYKDTIDIYATKDKALQLYKNGEKIYTYKNGKLFSETIFGIYLGNPPKDKKIKEALLKGF